MVESGNGHRHALRAYVVPAAPVSALELLASELRHVLSSTLSSHVPVELIMLGEIPRGADGRPDEERLPADVAVLDGEATFVAPRDATEAVLTRIWAEVLEQEVVGVTDDFFALGGNSLSAVRMIARTREALGVQVPFDRLFDAPTVAALAAFVTDGSPAGDEAGAPASGPVSEIAIDPQALSEGEVDAMLLDLLAARGAVGVQVPSKSDSGLGA